jgi:hypothetical protein
MCGSGTDPGGRAPTERGRLGMGAEGPCASGVTGCRATVRRSVMLVVVAVFLALTAGAVGGVAVGTSEAGTDSGPGERAALLDNVGPNLHHQVEGQHGQAGDRQRQREDSAVNICDREAATFVRVYNSQINSVPGLVADRIQDANVHLQVDGDADRDYKMVTDEEAQVVDYSEGKPAEASLRVETDCATFQEITDSQRPGERFRAAYADGRVRFVGLGPVNYVFFEGLNRVTDPIAWAVLLGLFLLLVVVLYLFYRRLTLYYRDDEDDAESDTGAGPPPGDGPPAQRPPDAEPRAGEPPSQGHQGSGRNAPESERQPTRGADMGQQGGPNDGRESRSGDSTNPESGGPTEGRQADSVRGQDQDGRQRDRTDASSRNRRG